MYQFVIGGLLLTMGGYLLNEAKKENCRAKRQYKKTYDRESERVRTYYESAKQKDNNDKHKKMFKLKKKIRHEIYLSLKKEKENLKIVNSNLFKAKQRIEQLFKTKHAVPSREEKRLLQQDIEIVLAVRKELFSYRDTIKNNLKILNDRYAKVQREITILEREFV